MVGSSCLSAGMTCLLTGVPGGTVLASWLGMPRARGSPGGAVSHKECRGSGSRIGDWPGN